MSEKKNNGWILEASLEFARHSHFWTFVWWIVIIVLVLQMSWLSIWTITDKWFGLEEKKLDQTYELQVQTFQFLQVDVMTKLDDIYERLDTVEKDTQKNKESIELLEKRVKILEDSH